MADLRAQVTINNRNGIPKDAIVNTWYFTSTLGKADPNIAPALLGFYQDVHAPAIGSVQTYLSPMLSRQPNSASIKVYDLADPEPREPEVYQWELTNVPAASALPNEVAVCLSFFADRNLPRRRGRVFIGPLSADAGVVDLTQGDLQVATGCREAILYAAQHLYELLNGPGGETGLEWVTHSVIDGATHPVTAGWVDNAFDIQRRRGHAPSIRQPFPIVG